MLAEEKAVSEQQWQHYLANRTPEHKSYKEREAEIVREVMQMDSYPDGLTRSEYLRQRLDEVRREIYATPSDTP